VGFVCWGRPSHNQFGYRKLSRSLLLWDCWWHKPAGIPPPAR